MRLKWMLAPMALTVLLAGCKMPKKEITVVIRERGSGTRVLLDYELKKRGILPTKVRGYRDEEYTHMNVAAAVLSGRADCTLGVRAAAVALGLDFIPVGVEQYDLVVAKAWADDERMQALMDVIRSGEFREAVSSMGGYDTSRSGEVLWEYDGN